MMTGKLDIGHGEVRILGERSVDKGRRGYVLDCVFESKELIPKILTSTWKVYSISKTSVLLERF